MLNWGRFQWFFSSLKTTYHTMPARTPRPWKDPANPRLAPQYRRLIQLAVQDDTERQKSIRTDKIITGDPRQRYIALTFDDGPHGERTTQLLECLHRLKVPATFFVVGKMALRYPELIERIVLEGHELGNHTYHHYRLPQIPLDQVLGELNRTRDLLTGLVGAPTRLFRPPGGEYNEAIQKLIAKEGYSSILWTDDPADYKPGRTPEKLTQLVLRDITPGGIILLHDGMPITISALPEMISRLRGQGYQLVTVSELIQRGGGLDHLPRGSVKISLTSAT